MRRQARGVHTEIGEAVSPIVQKEHGTMSNVNEPSINVEGEHVEEFVGEKRHQNMHAAINRLPIELLAYIFLLAKEENNKQLYMKYTWVCYCWRSVLIQNPVFWTLIRHPLRYQHPRLSQSFDIELLRRSEPVKYKLDLILSKASRISTFKELFTKESDRIRTLWISDNDEKLTRLVLSGKRFPSLRGLVLAGPTYDIISTSSLIRLLPVLVASDHLETLQLTLWGDDSIDRLAPILSRIRNLSFTFVHSIAPHLFKLIHNNSTLQNLQLWLMDPYNLHLNDFSSVILPELRFLSVRDPSILTRFIAPKLSSLDVTEKSSCSPVTAWRLNQFDFLSTRYLYIRGPQSRSDLRGSLHYCILLSKERTDCGSLFSAKTQMIYKDLFAQDYSQDCFHLKISLDSRSERFDLVPREIIPTIFPRLTNLVEVHFLFPLTLAVFQNTLIGVPSVEKVVVQRGKKLISVMRLLGEQTSLCPRLRQLSFKTLLLPEDLKRYAKVVGKGLVKCIEARRKACTARQLEYIVLGNCPPLSNSRLKEIQELGAEVVTEKSTQDIIRADNENLDEQYSDVEI